MNKTRIKILVSCLVVAVVCVTGVLFYVSTADKFETTSNGPQNTALQTEPEQTSAYQTEPGESVDTPSDSTDNSADKARYDEIVEILNDPYMKLVNRDNLLSSSFEPESLTYVGDYRLESTAASALNQMLAAAQNDGYNNFVFYSGYRTYSSQKNKYETRTQRYLDEGYTLEQAQAKAGEYIAPPGSSEHQSGLAADVCIPSIVNKYGNLNEAFDETDDFVWLRDNAHKFGFILRYPKGKESITGFNYEPWHYRYVGIEQATIIHEQGITFEEYHQNLQNEKSELEDKLNLK